MADVAQNPAPAGAADLRPVPAPRHLDAPRRQPALRSLPEAGVVKAVVGSGATRSVLQVLPYGLVITKIRVTQHGQPTREILLRNAEINRLLCLLAGYIAKRSAAKGGFRTGAR